MSLALYHIRIFEPFLPRLWRDNGVSMDDSLNNIHHGDCVAGMNALPAGSVDLAFADPPFNIGFEYDVYEDRREREHYLAWSKDWIAAVYRALKPTGTFWLAIGDEYAAELKVASQEIGFHPRSWVIWYYTFGVNCKRKFTRSHAHLFYFVKDPQQFTFRDDDLDNRIPSARQLVSNDKRSNPRGRLPDDTWIIRPADVVGELIDDEGFASFADLGSPRDDEQRFQIRPQDVESCFQADEDTWYFPRVAGTFKERAGFHGCQMPEQLLARIVRACSHETEIVLDPFSGSATTLVVAKKLGRQFVGFDLSSDYIKYGRERLAATRVGDRPEGSPEPLMSAPKTGAPRIQGVRRAKDNTKSQTDQDRTAAELRYDRVQLELTLKGVLEAFRQTHAGFSADRVVADPALNDAFLDTCRRLGIAGDARTWNVLLFRLRKSGKLAGLTRVRSPLTWDDCDEFVFASEIAWQTMLDDKLAESLDEILCDPTLAQQFDLRARRFGPNDPSLPYRLAALKVRKQAKAARSRGSILKPPTSIKTARPLAEVDIRALPETTGMYLVSKAPGQPLYAGEARNLRARLLGQFSAKRRKVWSAYSADLLLQTHVTHTTLGDMLAWQSCLVSKFNPALNVRDLRGAK
jgi:site-specific DNA-methyltransferase (adenine-specific)